MIVGLKKGALLLEISTQYGLVQEWNRKSAPTSFETKVGKELGPALERVKERLAEGYAVETLTYAGVSYETREPLEQILGALPPFEHLALTESVALTKADAALLPSMSGLHTLTVNESCAWGKEGALLAKLPRLPQLRTLSWQRVMEYVESKSTTDKRPFDLPRLTTLFPNLEALELNHEPVDSLDTLADLPKLHTLTLRSIFPKKTSTLRFLSQLPLRSLTFSAVGGDQAGSYLEALLALLHHLPRLERLDVSHSAEGESAMNLAPLASQPDLLMLGLSRAGVRDLSPIAKLKQLTELHLAGTSVSDLSPLAVLPLKFLDLEDVALKASTLAPLAGRADLEVSFKERRWPVDRLILFLQGKYTLPKLKDTARPTWILKTKSGDPGPLGSSFGGTPYLAPDESWPTCAKCQAAMPCIAQVSLTARKEPPNKGMLQVFHCTQCDDWTHDDRSTRVRIVEPKKGGESKKGVEPKKGVALPRTIKPRAIVSFDEKADQPSEEDARAIFGLKGPTRTQKGDKLSGWPLWTNAPEWHACPTCEGRMEMLLQIESHPKSNLQFGDMGRAHVQYCPQHPEVLRFGWSGN